MNRTILSNESMGNDLRTIDDCYTKFGLTNTSKSENSLPDDVRFFQRIVLTPKERAGLHQEIRTLLSDEQRVYFDTHYLSKKTRKHKGNCKHMGQGHGKK